MATQEPSIFVDMPGITERQQKAIVYVFNILNNLVDQGVLEGNAFLVTQQGLEWLGDFQPSTEEIDWAMEVIATGGYIKRS